MQIKRTTYCVGDIYRYEAHGTYWVLTRILPDVGKYVMSRNGVHRPLTSEEVEDQFTLFDPV